MDRPTEPPQFATVLVIAADPSIESLAGELVAFSGHRPVFDATAGAAGESVRRERPDVALIDTALPSPVVRACIGAAEESGSRVVLMSSTASADELAQEAAAEHCLHFVLPGGPRQLGNVLERALDRGPRIATRASVEPRARVPGAAHPALCAALASLARARVQSTRTARDGRVVQHTSEPHLSPDAQRTQGAVRAAIADYAAQLHGARLSEGDALLLVQEAVAHCAWLVGAGADMPGILAQSEGWVRQIYRTA